MHPSRLLEKLSSAYEELPEPQQKLIRTAAINAIIYNIGDARFEFPHLAHMTCEYPEVAAARIFHRSHAGWLCRKHDRGQYQYEHDESVAEDGICYFVKKYGRYPTSQFAQKALLHDSAEDYGTEIGNIEKFSGSDVAAGVKLLTIPPLNDLIELYPDLPKEKIILKYAFKRDSIAAYGFDEILIKFFDNLSAINDYVANMKNGQIMVTDDRTKADRKAEPPVFWKRDLLENLDFRCVSNGYLIERCQTIDSDPVKNPQALDCLALIPDFEAKFAAASEAFCAQVEESALQFGAGSILNASVPFQPQSGKSALPKAAGPNS